MTMLDPSHGTTAAPALDREALRRWYLRNRNRSAELFATFVPEARLDRPIPLRHPLAFYEGHLPAFSYNKLIREALGGPSIDPELEVLFERGIDPGTTQDAARHERERWPGRAAVQAFGTNVDRAILQAIASAELTNGARSPMLARGEAVFTILEHEQLHHETFAYLLQRLPAERKHGRSPSPHVEGDVPARRRVEIAAGTATLGTRRDAVAFGWDNEFDERTERVGRFEIDVDDVTNADYLRFVHDGGGRPPQWIERDGSFLLRTMCEEIPLPASWPVYVSSDQARAYAAWSGSDLMTEPEFHRAAYGSPSGAERAHPWGDDAPRALHGNFDFRRYDPEPVGSSPDGTSAWGVNDLVGNGWEWTKTPFAPLPGFAPMASYPPYSADFFDGKHFVIKGASPVTARTQLRRSFRNWFYADYPFAFTTFRTVSR